VSPALRFLTDEDFDNDILRGVVRRLPELDAVRVQDVGLIEEPDPAILEWAAAQERIVFTLEEDPTMTLLLNVTPELEHRLREAAERNGIPAEEYARRLLEEQLIRQPLGALENRATAEERQQRLNQWIQKNRGLPTLPEAAFHRASFYEEPAA
jgi:hypothetical protein